MFAEEQSLALNLSHFVANFDVLSSVKGLRGDLSLGASFPFVTLFQLLIFFNLAMPFLTRDQTPAPCIRSAQS